MFRILLKYDLCQHTVDNWILFSVYSDILYDLFYVLRVFCRVPILINKILIIYQNVKKLEYEKNILTCNKSTDMTKKVSVTWPHFVGQNKSSSCKMQPLRIIQNFFGKDFLNRQNSPKKQKNDQMKIKWHFISQLTPRW